MPRSKRSKVVSLTQTQKKGMEHKKKFVEDIRASLDEYKYVWIFSVGDMRADGLQEVRKLWKGTGRIIYGKNKVIAKALGTTEESEYKPGLAEIAKVCVSLLLDFCPPHLFFSTHNSTSPMPAPQGTTWTLFDFMGPQGDRRVV